MVYIVQHFAYRDWHQVNRQEELLTGGEKGEGRWWSWRKVSIGDGGQAAMSLMPDVDGSHVPIFESPQHEASCVGHLLCPT